MLIYHIAHLVSDVLEPRLAALQSGNHTSDFAANDSLGTQRLSERFTLVNPPKEKLCQFLIFGTCEEYGLT